MQNLSNVDGVNVDSMNITTRDDKSNDNITVTIEALGYASPNSTSGQIIISQDPSYKIIATAPAHHVESGIKADTRAMVITSVLKLY